MSDTWPPTQLERLDAEKDRRAAALEERVAELEKLVAMMRHAIDVAVLRVEPYPDDSKPAQLSPSVLPDIDDSPLAPAGSFPSMTSALSVDD